MKWRTSFFISLQRVGFFVSPRILNYNCALVYNNFASIPSLALFSTKAPCRVRPIFFRAFECILVRAQGPFRPILRFRNSQFRRASGFAFHFPLSEFFRYNWIFYFRANLWTVNKNVFRAIAVDSMFLVVFHLVFANHADFARAEQVGKLVRVDSTPTRKFLTVVHARNIFLHAVHVLGRVQIDRL